MANVMWAYHALEPWIPPLLAICCKSLNINDMFYLHRLPLSFEPFSVPFHAMTAGKTYSLAISFFPQCSTISMTKSCGYSTWTSLAVVIMQAQMMYTYPPEHTYPMAQYIALGNKTLLGRASEGEPRWHFCAVLSRLWSPGETESDQFGEEKALVMSFTALVNVWDRFDLSNSQAIQPTIRLIEFTVSTAFCTRLIDENYNTIKNPSPPFKDIIMPRLRDAVGRAGQTLNTVSTPELKDVATRGAKILSELASTMSGGLKNRPPPANQWKDMQAEIGYWRRLQIGFEKISRLYFALPDKHRSQPKLQMDSRLESPHSLNFSPSSNEKFYLVLASSELSGTFNRGKKWR
ncbi:hypothetical protein DFH08DRAFT_828116 [Mycena albidolilacea]|uniref:Uncharacterized protein n=1 Tax=Mycena albidolilacea TaxID=1033008 RepID=A0AAD7E6L0_9AGAR|nr:hypothetical protein DFH08DRAFT_828116 [Mycena albidolilacea]